MEAASGYLVGGREMRAQTAQIRRGLPSQQVGLQLFEPANVTLIFVTKLPSLHWG